MKLRKKSELHPALRNSLLYSIVIPAFNEEKNIARMLGAIVEILRSEDVPFEIVVVDDSSTDSTATVVAEAQRQHCEIRLVRNALPRGLGRAIRCGLEHFSGDVVSVVMADCSDSPEDIVRYYRKIEEGYDCVFGSRFIRGSRVSGYPPVKLVVNRVVNQLIRLMFMTRFNDLTNAFKAYRRNVIDSISPLQAAHFNITIEMSLSALIRRWTIAQIPISWTGKTWGSSNLRLSEMGRRYLCTLLMIWFERLLILDDLMAETANPHFSAADARRRDAVETGRGVLAEKNPVGGNEGM